MEAYRIGRIQEPWTNFTPPIRGGVYRKEDEESVESEEEDELSLTSRLGSFNSSSTSLDIAPEIELDSLARNRHLSSGEKNSSGRQRLDAHISSSSDGGDEYEFSGFSESHALIPSITVRETAASYTSKVVQQEIDDGIRDYPSFDVETQGPNTAKYRVLHQRIEDEGYYDCRYSEYGKELIRYSLIFAVFIMTLRCEWYLTSACFLGLFWVCLQLAGSLNKTY